MSVLAILGMKCKYQRQVKFMRFARRCLPQQERMMSMNYIQLDSRQETVDKRRDRNRSWDVNSSWQGQAWIAKDERVFVYIIRLFLRKYKNIMSLLCKLISK